MLRAYPDNSKGSSLQLSGEALTSPSGGGLIGPPRHRTDCPQTPPQSQCCLCGRDRFRLIFFSARPTLISAIASIACRESIRLQPYKPQPEREGFEPSVPEGTPVFETGPFSRSGTSPRIPPQMHTPRQLRESLQISSMRSPFADGIGFGVLRILRMSRAGGKDYADRILWAGVIEIHGTM